MKEITLSDKLFHSEERSRKYLEEIRWPDGPVCPHCGDNEKSYRLNGKSTRPGLLKCGACRKQYTVTVGTIFEDSHIPLNKWLLAVYLICSSKKGMSSLQLQRMLGVTYKSAWFMSHRIRHAMADRGTTMLKGIVEADETYVGGKGHGKRGRGAEKKTPVFALVERNGNVKSMPVKRVTAANLKAIMADNVDADSVIMTDDFLSYRGLDKDFSSHHVINHGRKEYVKGNVHTNTVEGYFSILKRGLIGVYHHVGKHHLHRYLSEFDFRYNGRKIDDTERSILALCGIEGKRLMYRDSSAMGKEGIGKGSMIQ